MSMKARGFACPETEELLLLHNIASLEEVENCSSLVLQELLQHKPLLHTDSSSLATRGGIEQFALRQLLHLQQASHTYTQSHDSQHSRTCKQHHLHSMQLGAEPQYPHPNDQPPAHDSSASLLNQALECSVLSTSALMSSSELLDHLVINSKGMTLPALCSEPLPVRKTFISAPKRAKRASLRRAAKKSSTFTAQFSPSEHGIIDSPCNGGKTGAPVCSPAKKCIPANHFLTERQRREFLNEKYQVLRSLIPNPTKADRASIVQDAIDHVNELKEHVEKLRLEKGSRDLKRRKVGDDGMGYSREGGEARLCDTGQHLLAAGKGSEEGKMCIQAQMTSKYGTGIDVRVMDDEATIKVTHHHSRDSFLLVAVLMLHEAQLELLHANGARIGNHHVYMLNVKIAEGKAMGATQIAKQLLECFDAIHAPAPPWFDAPAPFPPPCS